MVSCCCCVSAVVVALRSLRRVVVAALCCCEVLLPPSVLLLLLMLLLCGGGRSSRAGAWCCCGALLLATACKALLPGLNREAELLVATTGAHTTQPCMCLCWPWWCCRLVGHAAARKLLLLLWWHEACGATPGERARKLCISHRVITTVIFKLFMISFELRAVGVLVLLQRWRCCLVVWHKPKKQQTLSADDEVKSKNHLLQYSTQHIHQCFQQDSNSATGGSPHKIGKQGISSLSHRPNQAWLTMTAAVVGCCCVAGLVPPPPPFGTTCPKSSSPLDRRNGCPAAAAVIAAAGFVVLSSCWYCCRLLLSVIYRGFDLMLTVTSAASAAAVSAAD